MGFKFKSMQADADAVAFAHRQFTEWCRSFDQRSWRAVDKGLLDKPAWWRIDLAVGITTATYAAIVIFVGWWPSLLAALGGAMAAGLAVHRRRSRYRADCVAAIPDSLALMASALAAGHTLDQAIVTAVRAKGPLAAEFGRVQLRTRLGESLPDALSEMARRIRSDELKWVAISLRINARVGGEVSSLLSTVADTIRARDIVHRTLRALSAEGRMSALVLGLLPPGFALLLVFLQPTYLSPLIDDPRGRTLLVVAVVLFAVGFGWLRRAVRLDQA